MNARPSEDIPNKSKLREKISTMALVSEVKGAARQARVSW